MGQNRDFLIIKKNDARKQSDVLDKYPNNILYVKPNGFYSFINLLLPSNPSEWKSTTQPNPSDPIREDGGI